MSKENVPFGIGERAFSASSREQRIPVEEVDNEVVWVNSKINLPFNLKIGKSTKMALFFSPGPTGKSVKVHNAHHRSALISRAIFSDKEGRRYRDLDAKGVGYLYNEASENGDQDEMDIDAPRKLIVDNEALTKRNTDEEFSETGPWGFCESGYAKIDRNMSEKFLAKGVRTYRVAAIIALKEMNDNKVNKISFEESKRLHILRQEDEPVIELRAYTTRMRVINLTEESHLQDALALVRQETGNPQMDKIEYAHWFAKTLGEQVAKIHKAGYVHGYIQYHNITTDCHIVDLDSVYLRKELSAKNYKEKVQKDIEGGKDALEYLLVYGLKSSDENLKQELMEEYTQAYQQELK